MNVSRSAVLALCLLLCGHLPVAHAQQSLRGVVVDTSDAPIPGVLVLVERGLLRREVITDTDGRFVVQEVASGTVRVAATLSGFQPYRETLELGEVLKEVTIRLEPAAFAESVTVVPDGNTYRPASATTGTRLDLPLHETPQSVTVITSKVMADRQVLRLAELADNVAGVRASPGYGGLSSANYYMRGFRGSFSGGNLRDGFRDYTFLSSRDVQGIEQTEFLKGPASIIYGQQEVGGIVNTVLKKPQPWRFMRAGLVAGGFNLVRPTLDLNTPVNASGSLLFRFNSAYERADSHRDFVNHESFYLAPSVIWNAGPQTRLRINTEFQRYGYLFDNGYVAEPEMLTQPVSIYYGEPGFNYTKTRQTGVTVELSHAFGANWNVRSAFNGLGAQGEPRLINPIALQADRRTVTRSALRSDERSRNYSLQSELYGRFDTGGLRHNLVVGTELVRWNFRYLFESGTGGAPAVDRLNPVYGVVPTAFTPFFGDETQADIAGLYVQDQIHLGQKVRLLTGVRVDHVDQRSDDPLTDTAINSRVMTNVAPRAGLLFMPTRTTSVYVSYTNSFLPQYGVSRTGDRFDSQRGRQYEVGIKQNLVGDRLYTTLSLFQLWKTNVPTPDPVDPRFSILTGEQRSRGAEVEVTGRLTQQWQIMANYAGMDASVSRDNRLAVGSRLVGVPEHSGGVWTTYDVSRGRLAGLQVGGGVFGASERQARLPNVATVIPTYGRIDGLVGYRTRQWSVQLNIKNLNNVRWYEAQGANIIPQASRHALLSFGYQFQ